MSRTVRAYLCLAAFLAAVPAGRAAAFPGLTPGRPDIRSIGTLVFGSDGVLFIGDSRGGAVIAVDTGDRTPAEAPDTFGIKDLEAKIAAVLGTTAEDVMIHDMAVNPVSRSTYFSVSRARRQWNDRWSLPNDLADADVLLRVTVEEKFELVSLDDVPHRRITLPNPVGTEAKHPWKKDLPMRVEAITDMAVHDGTLYVSGLSNEEFSAALWKIDPSTGDAAWTTVEIYHGAHGEWETSAPIRTFLPYTLDGTDYMLASYLCTPLVAFPLADLREGEHVKGHTIAEFGSGNYPMDMLRVRWKDRDIFVMSNSQLPLMTFTPEAVREELKKPGITRETPTYTEGVPYTARAGTGVQHIDNFSDKAVAGLQRMPSGRLDLVLYSIERMAL